MGKLSAENGTSAGKGQARPTAPHRGLPLGKSCQNEAFERDPPPAGHVATPPHRGLRRRSRYPSQPENRPGLDGVRPAEGSRNSRAKRETVSGRRLGYTDGPVALG